MRRIPFGALLGLLLLLTGCGAPGGAAAPPAESAPCAPEVVSGDPRPATVEVSSIGASSDLIPLGLDESGGWAVPDLADPGQASWFSDGPMPGQRGPAVILGHVDGGGQPGVFARLAQVQVGDEVTIATMGGDVVRFAVVRVQDIPKAEFPTEEVLGGVPCPALRLITCGGGFDPEANSYRDSVVVYADQTSSMP